MDYNPKECLMTFIAVILGLICLTWMFCPRFNMNNSSQKVQEGFEEEALPSIKSTNNMNTSSLAEATGSLIDGPGFEASDIEGAQESSVYTVQPNYYFIDDGANGEMSVQHNMCSKSCCSEQWPTPFKAKHDPYVCQNKGQFVPTQMMCNNTFGDSGCMCVTKKQADFLANRGGNGREWF